MTLRITFGPWGQTLDELVQAARDAEAAGAEVVWAPEMHRSATITAAAMAAGTSTVGVGTAIALAFTRSPMVTALEALDLDELSQGRFRLGLGTGVQRLNEDWHNAQWGKPLGHLRETVGIIREFVARAGDGDPIQIDGAYEHMRMRGYQRTYFQQRTQIPIYLAGMGPAMTRLAAEIGDGWISHELCSPLYVKDAILPAIEEGLTRGSRQRGDVDLVVSACASVDADAAQARRWGAGIVGFYASVRTYADFFAFHGLAEQQAVVIDKFRGGATAQSLGDSVTDEMVDALTLSGTPEDVRSQIEQYEGLVDSIKLTPPTHGLDPEVTRRAQKQLIELIAAITEGSRPAGSRSA
jgi:probable F420-dependent oxidoreductase